MRNVKQMVESLYQIVVRTNLVIQTFSCYSNNVRHKCKGVEQMKFIEVTDRFGNSILINFDKVEHIQEVQENDKTFTKLQFNDGYLYIQETYTRIKSRLAGE